MTVRAMTGGRGSRLPIEPVLPELSRALRDNAGAVLVAEPGAGKTTRVPLHLLDEPWLGGRRIVMLEPRRLAARAAARFMAALVGEEVGETVGYRVRHDVRSGPRTRIEMITEGVLTRMLQSDPALEGVGLVIFDEFHERSIHADLGLAFCLESQAVLRPDLRLLVMSATIDPGPIARLMGDVPVVRSEGRTFPVDTRYLERPCAGPLEKDVERAVRRALGETEGDILVFLPGAGEIRRVAAALADLAERGVRVAQLHGALSHDEQDAAIAPSRDGRRKVVLATDIAETSLTVEGVRVVVDSGWARRPRFSPRTGMSRLEMVRVSKASADQRRGRAGRLGPGVCYRLWTLREEAQFAACDKPEILESDLASLALELALWGGSNDLRWLDPPPAAALSQARKLLVQLGALNGAGGATSHGRRMAELGIHPRLAHMVLAAVPLGLGATACELAALLQERDILRGGAPSPDADVRLRVEALRKAGGAGEGESTLAPGLAVDWRAARRIKTEARELMRRAGVSEASTVDPEACGLLLTFAYPDRIAQRRPDGRYLLCSGRGAAFSGIQSLAASPYIVAAELDDKGPESRILLAAPVDLADIERTFKSEVEQADQVEWDPVHRRVAARRRVRLGALVLREEPLRDPDPGAVLASLLAGIRVEGLAALPWSEAARRLQQRVAFVRRFDPDWPDVSDEALLRDLDGWLAPYLHGKTAIEDLSSLDLAAIVEGMLSWEQRRKLDVLAPAHFVAPSGSRIPIDYSDPHAPSASVRLQEVFGLAETPRIGAGRVPLRLVLLSPAMRPVQVTQDLASFWRGAYFDVRKELKGRYPKHYWPDDPLQAEPKQLKPR